MKNLIILVFALASGLAIAFALPSNATKSRNLVVPAGRPEGRITRGRSAVVKQFPYQVGLDLTHGDGNIYFCGGSLVNHKLVLTAAHCTNYVVQVKVLLGATNRDYPEVTHVVSKENIIIHDGYNPRDHHVHDISLIVIPYTQYTSRIQPVKLPAMGRSYSDYSGDDVVASGWGRIGDLQTDTTNNLQWAELNIIPNRICQRSFGIYSTNICTATIGGVNICNGDSGGPLVLESSQIQIGITSFGAESCLVSAPSVYTRVTSYLRWINDYARVVF